MVKAGSRLQLQENTLHHFNSYLYCYNINLIRDFCKEDVLDSSMFPKLFIKELVGQLSFDFHTNASYYNNQGRTVAISVNAAQDVVAFIIQDIVAFYWKKNNPTIFYRRLPQATTELMNYWLVHIALPIFFSYQRTYFFLHAGAVLTADEKSIAFMAPCNGGKSTLTDYFLQQGHALVTDDKLGLLPEENHMLAVPSHPYQRPYRAIETLGKCCANVAQKPSILQTIFILNPVASDANIHFTPLRGIDKFTQLRYGAEINYEFGITDETQHLSYIGNRVRMAKIDIPWDMQRLPEVYDSILKYTQSETHES